MTEAFKLETAAPETLTFAADTIDTYSDPQLDEAPFGIICLDEDATILRYNLYESRFARLDRNQVLGLDFFEQVARCTRGPGFEGKFHRVVGGSRADGDLQFQYVFDFTFGAQQVDVEIVPAAHGPRFYLLINRRRLQGPRASAVDVGALQEQLAPDEVLQGVRRDSMERRFAEVPMAFFAGLRSTFAQLAPETWPIFSYEWGLQWGRRVAIELEASSLELFDSSVPLLSMTSVAELVGTHFETQGWGRLEFDFAAAREGLFEVRVARSLLAESAPRSGATSVRACALLAGAFAGVFGHVAGRRLSAREIRCKAQGADGCGFAVTGFERAAQLDEAIGQGVDSIEQIRSYLLGAVTRSPRS